MQSKKGRQLKPRYSIGEWYGESFEQLSPELRIKRAKIEIKKNGLVGNLCPFVKDAKCNKKGGVCSIRRYQKGDDGVVSCSGPLVTTCPARFLENDEIFRWVGNTILKNEEPIVLSQIGFLNRRIPKTSQSEKGGRDFIGRIDNVLVHPTKIPLEWCALELQAVYFSGTNMRKEFSALAINECEGIPFPAANRRPDWRSSGPKRLLPQLETKVPTIRTWGKKMAVVIDEAFFESLVGLERVEHLSSAEIVWFVVGYDKGASNGWTLALREVAFTTLEGSVKALTSALALSQEAFEEQLRLKLKASHPKHPLTEKLA